MTIGLIMTLALLTGFDESRFMNSSRQMFDSSCGFSSVASIMKDWYGDDISETSLISETFDEKNVNVDYSVSMKMLSQIFSNHGYLVKGYKMTFDELEDAVKKHPPVLVHYGTDEGHFVLVLGIDGEKVVVSDPSEGVRTIFKDEFEKLWSRNVMLVGHREKNISVEKLQTVIEETQLRLELLNASGRL